MALAVSISSITSRGIATPRLIDHVGAFDRLDHLALAGANVNVEVVV